jgi:tetratricopeptide (TPR) repeat protein
MLDSQLAEAHANLANALQQIGNYDMAVIYYQACAHCMDEGQPGKAHALSFTWPTLLSAYLPRGRHCKHCHAHRLRTHRERTHRPRTQVFCA